MEMMLPRMIVILLSVLLLVASGTANDGQDLVEMEDPLPLSESAFGLQAHEKLRFSLALQQQEQQQECPPEHIHLSRGNTNTEVFVSFSISCPPSQAVPSVSYGQWLRRGQQRAHRVAHYEMTSSVSFKHYKSPWIYHVTLPGLRPGLISYWYRIDVEEATATTTKSSVSRNLFAPGRLMESQGNQHSLASSLRGSKNFYPMSMWRPKLIGQSSSIHFKSPPNKGVPVTLAVVGDLGQTYNSTLTMARIYNESTANEKDASMLILAGDMSYADSEQSRWLSWFSLVEPLLSKLPIEVTSGNHEIECDYDTGNIFVPYESWFDVPNRLGPARMKPVPNTSSTYCSTPSAFFAPQYEYGNAYYTFSHGMVRVIVLSSYSDTTEGSPQYKWLQSQLLDRQQQQQEEPWLVVMFHCPLYTTFKAHNHEKQTHRMRKNMEPLFIQYQVNLIVSGHDHAYMRTYPLGHHQPTQDDDGDVEKTAFEYNEKGPIYLTVGAGGNREGHIGSYLNPDEKEAWVAVRDHVEFGFGLLKVVNETHARWTWIPDETVPGGVFDDVWLENVYLV